MQKLLLANDLMDSVLKKEKTATCRLGARDILPGKLILQSATEETFKIRVNCTSVRLTTFDRITVAEAEAEGHTPKSLYLAMLEFYPDMKPDDLVTYISWEC